MLLLHLYALVSRSTLKTISVHKIFEKYTINGLHTVIYIYTHLYVNKLDACKIVTLHNIYSKSIVKAAGRCFSFMKCLSLSCLSLSGAGWSWGSEHGAGESVALHVNTPWHRAEHSRGTSSTAANRHTSLSSSPFFSFPLASSVIVCRSSSHL